MIRTITLCMLSMLFAQPAFAASYDCDKANTKVEKMICADPELSKLDAELGKVFSKALKESSDPSTLKQRQRDWLKERNQCEELSCLGDSYKNRLGDLNQAPPAFVAIQPPDITEFDMDCANPRNEKEKFVCVEAGEEHRAMIVALQWSLMRSKDKQKIITAQRQWQQQVRDVCQDGYCLRVKAYRPRIEELRNMLVKRGQCYVPMPLLDVNGYVKPLEPVCQVMERNLNQFCDQPPMVCQLKVTPEFEQKITFPTWKPLDPRKNMALIEAFIRAPWQVRRNQNGYDETVWEREKKIIEVSLAADRLNFSESILDLYNLGKADISYRLDYGTCNLDNAHISEKASWNKALKVAPVKILFSPLSVNRLDYILIGEYTLNEVFSFDGKLYSYLMGGNSKSSSSNGENVFLINIHRKEERRNSKPLLVMENMCQFDYRVERGVGK